MRTVMFDLFETLITEFDPQWRSAPTTAQRLGIDEAVFGAEWRRFRTPRMTAAVDFRDVLRDICTGYVDAAVIEELHAERLAAKAATLTRVSPEIVESLSRLRAAGFRIGLISNCAVEEVAAWGRSPLAGFFDDVVFSYAVGCVKPEPGIYRMACERLGVAARDVVFIGDGGSDELRGAARVGMTPYCARWYLDNWPAWRHQRSEFPPLAAPGDILAVVGGGRASADQ